jgi:hypothetical protein
MVGQVERVVPYKDRLVLFRRVPIQASNSYGYHNWKSEALVYDLSDPKNPQKEGSAQLPAGLMPYYWYWCGPWSFWGGFWFDHYHYGYPYHYGNSTSWILTGRGPVFLTATYDQTTGDYLPKLVFLDLSNTSQPAVSEYQLSSSSKWTFLGLTADPSDPDAFYLSYRVRVGQKNLSGATFNLYKYYAQRWVDSGTKWTAGTSVNLPGRLMKTWNQGGQRLYLTYDFTYSKNPSTSYTSYSHTFRLNLLRKLGGLGVAQLLDYRAFPDFTLKGVVRDGERLFVNARPDYNYQRDNNLEWYEVSDHLMIFDLGGLHLDEKYGEPTGTYQVRMMGVNQGKLFLNLPGDGILAVDVSNPAAPVGQKFMRTLGYATHLEFAGSKAYVAAGYFGIFEMDLGASPVIPTM